MQNYVLLNEYFANSKDIRKNTKAKKFLAFDKTENTFRVIPKLEDLDKRLMLLVSPWLKEYYSDNYYTTIRAVIPQTFTNVFKRLENIENFVWRFIFRNQLFEMKIKSFEEIEIAAIGLVTEEDEFEYPNIWKILYSFGKDEDIEENPDF